MNKTQLQEILDLVVEEKQTFVIHTADDRQAVVVPYSEYESLRATLEELTDPGARRAPKEAQEDIAKGRLHSYKEVFGGP